MLHTDWCRSWLVRKILPCGYISIKYWPTPGCNNSQHCFWESTTLVQYNGGPAVPHYRFCGLWLGYKWLDDDCSTSTCRNTSWDAKGPIISILWCELLTLSGSSWTWREDKGGREDNSGEGHTVCSFCCLREHGASDWTRSAQCVPMSSFTIRVPQKHAFLFSFLPAPWLVFCN